MTMTEISSVRAIVWQSHCLKLLDQRRLPREQIWFECQTTTHVVDAIRSMVVRGAPAIGIAAAYGVVLAAYAHRDQPVAQAQILLVNVMDQLAEARPTAVNLMWALAQMREVLFSENILNASVDWICQLEQKAKAIHQADYDDNFRMAELGAQWLAAHVPQGKKALTHCNTGALATAGYGTALGVIRTAFQKNIISGVYVDETRPWLQGTRLTAWELQQEKIPFEVIVDSAAASILRQGQVSCVLVGADRIAKNGDVVNKIGTYALAIAARYHQIKLMVVAPTSTLDLTLNSGVEIPIETREGSEILAWRGEWLAPEYAQAYNPVFDMTPAELIDVIVTERGVIENPAAQGICF